MASLERVADKHDNVSLFNIQQLNQKEYIVDVNYETIYDQGDAGHNSVKDSASRMPMVKGFFNALADTDCDYFVFLNSDIILTSKVVRLIQDYDYDSISVSRLAIHDIDSIDDSEIKHGHFQVAGFDVWAVKKDWWLENVHKFPDYVYAVSAWDVDYSSRMMVLGNSLFDTEFPPGCYHIMHDEKSHDDTPDRKHNVKLFWKDWNSLCDAWHGYFYEMLEERKKLCPNYTKVGPNEQAIIDKHFKNEDIHTKCNV